MDLENELRQAMAEQVTGMSAPRTLAHDAKRRHQRTVRRRATVAVAAAGIVVAVAMVPTYQAIRPQPVGAPGPGGRQSGGGPRAGTDTTTRPATPGGGSRSAAPKPTGEPTHAAVPPSRHPAGTHSAVAGVARSLLGYLPAGIRPDGKCDTQDAGHRKTTLCRWTGPAGWIEVRLVHDGTLVSPADMGLAPAVPKYTVVHGHTALRGDGPATLSQIMWIERSGLGVWVGVSPGLSGSLADVADGVHTS
jgi:hypothetical protein